MVMSERNSYNGSRTQTRNASINARSNANINVSGDSSDDEPYDHGMRVGSDYQAVVPHISTVLQKPALSSISENAVLVWSPVNDIPEEKLDEYIQIAKEKYNYNMEQALGMLCWHKYDIAKALADMPNFTPFPDEWTVEDKVLFEQAFQFHDKHFQKIKQMLPDKSLSSLVKYYYSWKKTRSRTSLMDRQVKKLNTQKDESDAGSDAGSENDSENGGDRANSTNGGSNGDNGTTGRMGDSATDSGTATTTGATAGSSTGGTVGSGDRGTSNEMQKCENCHTKQSGQFHQTNKGVLCRSCYSYWRRTGMLRPGHTSTDEATNCEMKTIAYAKRKPPRGMFMSVEDLCSMAKGPPGQADAMLRALDQELIDMKRQRQSNKQIISQLEQKKADGIDSMRLTETGLKLNPRWTTEEQLLAVQAFRKYGKNFKSIAELLGTKSELHVRNFYLNNDKKYGLSAIVKEFQEQIDQQ